MNFRWILPGIFTVFFILFIAANIVGVGHGINTFDFVLYSSYPAAFLTDGLQRLVGGPGLLWLVLGLAGGALQYYLIGYVLDKFLRSR